MCKKMVLISFVLALCLLQTSAVNAELVGWWKLDEGEDTTVTDSSGRGHDGAFFGGNPEWVEGKMGTALKFGDPSDVEIPDHNDFHMVNAVSIAVWAKPDPNQQNYAKFLLKQKAPQYPYGLQFNETQEILGVISSEGQYFMTPAIPNFAGEWGHLCLTYDGANLILYKDGEVASQIEATGELTQNNKQLYIGGRGWDGQDFTGIIDEVKLYSHALLPAEVQTVMKDTKDLIGWWKLDEGAGEIAYDSSGNGNDGFLIGGVAGTPEWTSGDDVKVGASALQFHGGVAADEGDYVDCGASPVFDITGDITLSCWVRVEAFTQTYQYILSKGVDYMILRNGSTPFLRVVFNGLDHTDNNYFAGGTTIPIDDGQWHHVVGTYEESTGTVAFYTDGILEEAKTTTGNLGINTESFCIGMRPTRKGTDVIIDEVRLYSRALTELDVLPPVDPNAEGLVAYYPMDNDANDASDNGNNGTVIGTPVWGVGKSDSAIVFDANCTGIDCGVFDPTDGTGTFSLTLWAFWDGTGTFQHFFTKSNGWGDDTMMFQVELWGGHSSQTYTDRVGVSYRPAGSVPFSVMPKNEWAHLAFTFDGSMLTLYHNGVDEEGPKAFSIGPNIDAPVLLGQDNTGKRIFHGSIDEVMVYNRALSAPEVRFLAGEI